MIKITYGSREPPSLTVVGHARFAESGKDIICAAASTLFITLANSLAELTDDTIRVRHEPGDGAIIWVDHISDDARLILDSYLIGLRCLAEEYPEYVVFEIV